MIYNERMQDLEEENKRLKEENKRLKEEICKNKKENIDNFIKRKKSCYNCLNYEDLAGKVTYIGKPPSPQCRLGKPGFPYCGELCDSFFERSNNIIFPFK